jgi:hypothetical protein
MVLLEVLVVEQHKVLYTSSWSSTGGTGNTPPVSPPQGIRWKWTIKEITLVEWRWWSN